LLRYKDNPSKLIKNAVISLLPRAAASNREEFTKARFKEGIICLLLWFKMDVLTIMSVMWF
jgi:hypothetical protein